MAELLHLSPRDVGIKAKTPEGLNQDHVAVAHATVLLESIEGSGGIDRMKAVVEDDAMIDGVVESLIGGRRDTSALGRKLPSFDTGDLT